MNDHKPAYKAYLLRLWEEDDHENSDDKMSAPVWRASLEDASTHERHGFDRLDALFEFLERQTTLVLHDHNIEHKSSASNIPNFLQGETP